MCSLSDSSVSIVGVYGQTFFRLRSLLYHLIVGMVLFTTLSRVDRVLFYPILPRERERVSRE